MNKRTISFIGAGQMAEAILSCLIAGDFEPDQILCLDKRAERLQHLSSKHGVRTTTSLAQAAGAGDTVVLAVKPADMPDVCALLGRSMGDAPDQTLISIAAGVGLAQIRAWLNVDINLIRAMPSLTIEVGQGLTALYADVACPRSARQTADKIFAAGSDVIWLDREEDMHLVTAVSGSGPGFFFYLLEQMTAAAVQLGMSPEAATKAVLATALGSSSMAARSDAGLENLRQRVTSPGGTTARGLARLEQAGLEQIFAGVFTDAMTRSKELSAPPKPPQPS